MEWSCGIAIQRWCRKGGSQCLQENLSGKPPAGPGSYGSLRARPGLFSRLASVTGNRIDSTSVG